MTCSADLPTPSNSPEVLTSLVHEKFEKIHIKGTLYRTTGVTLGNLVSNFTSQKDLFGGTIKADKFDLIHKHLSSLEDKFGKRAVYLASTHMALKHKEKGTGSDDLDHDLLFL